MSAQVEKMAYVGETPWHREGLKMKPGQSIVEWRTAAGLDWEYKTTPVKYDIGLTTFDYKERQVVYRGDTEKPLAVVSNRFKLVQPAEVLDFFKDFLDAGDMTLETAGSLRGGRTLWALAQYGDSFRLFGQDEVFPYLCFMTSVDTGMATTIMNTFVRVVCQNTVNAAYFQWLKSEDGTKDREAIDSRPEGVRISHLSRFDAEAVKAEMGLIKGNADLARAYFRADAETLAEWKPSMEQVHELLIRIYADPQGKDLRRGTRTMAKVTELFGGAAMGSGLRSARLTGWGLVNAVTEYADHHARGTDAQRLASGVVGSSAAIKRRAMVETLRLAKAA